MYHFLSTSLLDLCMLRLQLISLPLSVLSVTSRALFIMAFFLKRHQILWLIAFTNADWASNHDDYTCISAHIVYLGGNAILWCSKKQNIVARSSTEAKYRSLASCSTEILWIKDLLQKLEVPCSFVPQIFCDNIGATYLSVNPIFHSCMKHIAIDYYFIRYHVLRIFHCFSYLYKRSTRWCLNETTYNNTLQAVKV